MQTDTGHSNQRRGETRKALLATARRLFAETGFENTTVDEIVLSAAVSRGAFYFEFEDKREIFRAVVERDQEDIAWRMGNALTKGASGPFDALVCLARAFLDAVAGQDTRRIVFVDGPRVLGRAEWLEICRRHWVARLESGLQAAIKAGEVDPLPVEPLLAMLGATFTEAALALDTEAEGPDADELLRILGRFFEGLRAPPDVKGGQAAEVTG